jgi:hypothetical protein
VVSSPGARRIFTHKIPILFILLALVFCFGCSKEKVYSESDFMKLHNSMIKNASVSCGGKNMIFQSVDIKNFNEYDYYCYISSPYKVFKNEGVIDEKR